MAKNFQLHIDNPCHENWDKMTPTEKGRFCGSCQKQVVDFTRMSDSQIAAFFKKPTTGSVCGRFMDDQLNKDLEVPRKRIPWVKYFFTVAIPAFFVTRSAAQGEVKMIKGDTIITCAKTPVLANVNKPLFINAADSILKGRVVDENDKPVAGAAVILKGSNVGTAANNEGYFELKVKDVTPLTLITISSIGYYTQDYFYVAGADSVTIKLRSYPMNFTLGVIVVGKPRIKATIIPLIPSQTEDESKMITAYPNPVASGSLVTLATKKLKKGEYTLRVISISGQVVHTVQQRIDKNGSFMFLQLPTLKPGDYLISVDGKASYSAKLVIQ